MYTSHFHALLVAPEITRNYYAKFKGQEIYRFLWSLLQA
jgi:hypothetical protein